MEVYVPFDIDSGDCSYITESCWHQGKVIKIAQKRYWQTLKVVWNAMPIYESYEEPEMMEQTLLPNKWNNNCDNTWQYYVGTDYSCRDRSRDCDYSECDNKKDICDELVSK